MIYNIIACVYHQYAKFHPFLQKKTQEELKRWSLTSFIQFCVMVCFFLVLTWKLKPVMIISQYADKKEAEANNQPFVHIECPLPNGGFQTLVRMEGSDFSSDLRVSLRSTCQVAPSQSPMNFLAALAPSLRECSWNIDLPTYQLRVGLYIYTYEFVLKSNDIPQDSLLIPLDDVKNTYIQICSLSNSVISFSFWNDSILVHFLQKKKKTSHQQKKRPVKTDCSTPAVVTPQATNYWDLASFGAGLRSFAQDPGDEGGANGPIRNFFREQTAGHKVVGILLAPQRKDMNPFFVLLSFTFFWRYLYV